MKKLAILVILFFNFRVAYAASGVDQPLPELTSTLQLIDSQYEQLVRIVLPSSINLEKARAWAKNGALMNEINDWVTDAKYSNPNAVGDYEYWLSIGKMGMVFTHAFNCHEESAHHAWVQSCSEIANKPNGKKVVFEGESLISCEKNETKPDSPVICEFGMRGRAGDLNVMLKKIPGREIAYKLFLENTSYIAHWILMITGQAQTVAAARALLPRTSYARLLADLSARQRSALVQSQSQLGVTVQASDMKNSFQKVKHFASN